MRRWLASAAAWLLLVMCLACLVLWYVAHARHGMWGYPTGDYAPNSPAIDEDGRLYCWTGYWMGKQRSEGCCVFSDPPDVVHEHRCLGITFETGHWNAPPRPGAPLDVWRVSVPLWLLAALLGAWPAIRLPRMFWRWWRAFRRRRASTLVCHRCRYDLRGSMGSTTCPECGAIIAPTSTSYNESAASAGAPISGTRQ